MKRYLLILAAVLAALLLAGCNRGIQTSTASHEGFTPLSDGSKVGYTYSYSMEYLTGGLPQEVVDPRYFHIGFISLLYFQPAWYLSYIAVILSCLHSLLLYSSCASGVRFS